MRKQKLEENPGNEVERTRREGGRVEGWEGGRVGGWMGQVRQQWRKTMFKTN